MKVFVNDKLEEVSRIYMGLAWPGSKPGFICVLAEGLYPHKVTKEPMHFYLDEWQGNDLNELIYHTIDLKLRYRASMVFGKRDKMFMRTLRDWNKFDRPEAMPQLNLFTAQKSEMGLITPYLHLIRKGLEKGKQTLHGTKKKIIQRYIDSVPFGMSGRIDLSKARDGDYPALSALGYVLMQFKAFPLENMEMVQSPVMAYEDLDPVTGY